MTLVVGGNLRQHFMTDNTFDPREFLRDLLSHWLASVNPNGLFHPDFDRRWNRLPSPSRTLVSQCRLIYNFSRGFEVFDDARFADAAASGLDALARCFQIAPGEFRWSVGENGEEMDATPDAYGHAFVILATATAARVLGTPTKTAWETREFLDAQLTDERGGLIWRGRKSQNPIMHLFEASTALCATEKSERARDAAAKTLAFAQTLENFDAGRLVERFDDDWNPQTIENGGVLDLGHACEWAFLLSDWSEVTGEKTWQTLGERFLQVGVELGLTDDGAMRAAASPSGEIVAPHIGLWQQCEAVRALHRAVKVHKNANFDVPFARALTFYRSNFVDKEHGGVFAGLESDKKGDAWKLDYHTANLCLELCRQTQFGPKKEP